MAEYLFSGDHLSDALRNQEELVKAEVASFSEERVLGTDLNDLLDYFVAKYRADVPVVYEEGITTDHSEIQIDVSDRFDYGPFRGSGRRHAAGTRYVVTIPYEGNRSLFRLRPSTYSFGSLTATIGTDSLVFAYERLPHETSNLRVEIKRDLDSLKKHLGRVASDVSNFDERIRTTAEHAIEARRKRLHDAQATAQQLGFPLQRRSDAPQTYAAPEVRRKIAPKLPPVTLGQGALEPVLNTAEYEHILGVMSNMVTVMERSPSAFREMQEEDLRQHFLVQLNAQYEGQATAETFNANGKTDILIRVDGKNIFIAECKFWNGAAHLAEALDQLLSYTTWRDTKTALLVFNRNVQMSTVLSRIPEVVEQHPNHKATLNYDSETGFRYTLSHTDDPERDLTLTVLVFDVPAGD